MPLKDGHKNLPLDMFAYLDVVVKKNMTQTDECRKIVSRQSCEQSLVSMIVS